MTSLQREWEARLEAEGLGAEPFRTSAQSLTNANTDLPCVAYADSPRLARWTQLTHAVHALPIYFHNRKLLVTFCELGYVSKTARQHKVSRVTVYRALKALERYIQHAR